ncbi:hypothetical protein MRX96_002848 [Rhipicephalus microplus]
MVYRKRTPPLCLAAVRGDNEVRAAMALDTLWGPFGTGLLAWHSGPSSCGPVFCCGVSRPYGNCARRILYGGRRDEMGKRRHCNLRASIGERWSGMVRRGDGHPSPSGAGQP